MKLKSAEKFITKNNQNEKYFFKREKIIVQDTLTKINKSETNQHLFQLFHP